MSFDPPKPTILLQLDTDPAPSVFDAVVAADSGVGHLLRHGGVRPETVTDLVQGLLFTRGPADLKRSAVSVGGSDVAAGEAVFQAVQAAFFGPFRVSVLLDSNGANTTAASAVLAALDAAGGTAEGKQAVVLGAGPVGRRIARLLLGEGFEVAIGTPSIAEGRAAADSIGDRDGRSASAFAAADPPPEVRVAASILIAAGPKGVTVLPRAARSGWPGIAALIDLNAVPPAGIEGVEAADKGADRDGVRCWGPLGIGGRKMKIHRAAVRSLFESNDRVLDAEAILALARDLA